MKFCEKLQKLRKEKNMSQEQLADLLDVSRQSVSKWESGTTYPEMDKLLSLCKIFDVTLDDLTNDEVTDKDLKEKTKSNFSNFVYAIIDMINKSVEMFKNMNKKEIVKCITELFILAIILLLFKIPFSYIDSLARDIFINFSDKTFYTLNSIWLFLSNIIYLILFVTVFIYVYKIRFLDKYNYEQSVVKKVEEKETEEVNVEKVTEEHKPKERHSFILFDFLGSLFNIFIKICLIFLVIPLIITFVFLVICTTVALIAQFIGLHYIGVFIALLGATVSVCIIMELFIRFLLSSNIPFKRMFLVFLIGLISFGIGSGLTAYEFSKVDFIDDIPDYAKLNNITENYPMSNALYIIPNLYYGDLIYVVDETKTEEVELSVDYYSDYIKIETNINNNELTIGSYHIWDDTLNVLDIVINDLKNKKIYNYDLLSRADITITTSSANIEIIKNNIDAYHKQLEEQAEEYNYYINEIDRLYSELDAKDNQIYDLEEQLAELQEKLDNIYSVME